MNTLWNNCKFSEAGKTNWFAEEWNKKKKMKKEKEKRNKKNKNKETLKSSSGSKPVEQWGGTAWKMGL